jgi:hypothetical protein
MATGRRLLEESMPYNYKQGSVYPTHYDIDEDKPYGGSRKKNAGHVRKMGQNKVRKQLKKELYEMLEENDQID